MTYFSGVEVKAETEFGAKPSSAAAAGAVNAATTGTATLADATVDVVAAEAAVAQLLLALGRDPHSPQFALTPKRVVQNLRELTTALSLTLSTFPNPGDQGEPVVMRDIPFVSVCEHHLLPFRGVAHVGYAPLSHIVGFSAFVQVVEHFAHNFQVQERLTIEIADFLACELDSNGVGVTIEAEHSCVSTRGAKPHRTSAVTQAFRGPLADDTHFRSLFAISAPAHTLRGR